MFAALGSISFQTIASPTKFETNNKFHFAKLDVIGGAPQLQWIYDDLTELTLDVTFHQLWCNPTTSITALMQLAQTHQPQALVFGNGTNVGKFVILEVRVKNVWRADNGNLLAADCSLTLQSYVQGSQSNAQTPQAQYVGQPPAVGTIANQTPTVEVNNDATVAEKLGAFTQNAALEAEAAYAGIEAYFFALETTQLAAFGASLFASPIAASPSGIAVVPDYTTIPLTQIARWSS